MKKTAKTLALRKKTLRRIDLGDAIAGGGVKTAECSIITIIGEPTPYSEQRTCTAFCAD